MLHATYMCIFDTVYYLKNSFYRFEKKRTKEFLYIFIITE